MEEFKIGTKIEVVESNDCSQCVFENYCEFVKCWGTYRKDGKNIIFKIIK